MGGFYDAVPFLAASTLLSASVFVTAVAINRPVAFLVPLVGATCGVLITYYTNFSAGDIQRDPVPFTDEEFLRSWWISFRFGVIPLWLASALGLWFGDRFVEKSPGSDPRLRVPETRTVIIWTLASVAVLAATYVASIELGYQSSIVSIGMSLLATPGWIALVIGPAILFTPAAAAFSLFPIAAAYHFGIKAGVCGMDRFAGSERACSPFIQIDVLIREALPYVVVYALAMIGGWWARRPETDTERAHSGGDSISSSKLPAGSRT